MSFLRCNKPGCGNTFIEGTPEFEDGFCTCGASLVEVIEEQTSETSINDIINGDSMTPRFEHEVKLEAIPEVAPTEQPQVESLPVEEVITPQQPLVEVDETITFSELTSQNNKEAVEEVISEHTESDKEAIEENNVVYALEDEDDAENDDSPLYLIGKNNEIVYKQDKAYKNVYDCLVKQGYFGDPYGDYNGDRIVLILNGRELRTYPLECDETLVGREHDEVKPEIDYTDIDEERYISRRHALIYRQQNEYFIRNESNKNSVHVNKEVLQKKEFRCLQDGDKIVLSRKYGLVFKKKSESEHI